MYSALLHASSNASLGTSSATGTFYAIEVANVTFTSGVCAATLAAYKVVSGTATGLDATNIPCHNGVVVRAVMLGMKFAAPIMLRQRAGCIINSDEPSRQMRTL